MWSMFKLELTTKGVLLPEVPKERMSNARSIHVRVCQLHPIRLENPQFTRHFGYELGILIAQLQSREVSDTWTAPLASSRSQWQITHC